MGLNFERHTVVVIPLEKLDELRISYEKQKELLRSDPMKKAAVKTLQGKGYTYHGGMEWAPPLGRTPDLSLLDKMQAEIDQLKRDKRDLECVARGEIAICGLCENKHGTDNHCKPCTGYPNFKHKRR